MPPPLGRRLLAALDEEMHNTIHEPSSTAASHHLQAAGHTLAAALSLSHSRVAS
jgi:hypothetical protein